MILKDNKFVEFDYQDWVKNNHLAMNDAAGPGAGMRIKVLASASGVLVNGRVYPGPEWKKAASKFADKPFLKHHDRYKDAIGRIQKGQFEQLVSADELQKDHISPWNQTDKKGGPSGLVYVTGDITDPDAIMKLGDKRLLNTSQGSGISGALCNICGKDQVQGFCEHEPGNMYEVETDSKKKTTTKLAFWIAQGMSPKELSFVNDPALEQSRVVEMDSKDSKIVDYIGAINSKFNDTYASNLESFELYDMAGKSSNIVVVNESPIEISTEVKNQANPIADELRESDSSNRREDQMELDLKKELEDSKKTIAELTKSLEDKRAENKKLGDEKLELQKTYDALQKEYESSVERETNSVIDQVLALRTNLDEKTKEAKRKELQAFDLSSLRLVLSELKDSQKAEVKPVVVVVDTVKEVKPTEVKDNKEIKVPVPSKKKNSILR